MFFSDSAGGFVFWCNQMNDVSLSKVHYKVYIVLGDLVKCQSDTQALRSDITHVTLFEYYE